MPIYHPSSAIPSKAYIKRLMHANQCNFFNLFIKTHTSSKQQLSGVVFLFSRVKNLRTSGKIIWMFLRLLKNWTEKVLKTKRKTKNKVNFSLLLLTYIWQPIWQTALTFTLTEHQTTKSKMRSSSQLSSKNAIQLY